MLARHEAARTQGEQSAPDKQIALGLTRLLYLNLPLGLLGTVVIAAALAYALVGHVPQAHIIAWLCSMVAVSAARHWLCLRFNAADVGLDNVRAWEDRFLIGAFISGLTWGAASIFLFPLGSLPHQVFLGFILASMAAGAVSTLGMHLRVYTLYLLPGLLPYSIRLLAEGGELQIGMGLVFAFGQIILLVSARRFSAVTVTSLSLRHEKQQLVDALRSALAKAEDTSRAKTLFMANMSHEIRTPMNGVLGLTRLLMRTDLDERQSGLVNTIERSAGSLLSIINDNLDFSKFETRNFRLTAAPFDFKSCLADVARLASVDADRKGVPIRLSFDEGVPACLVGDETRVRQICNNLVNNAVKFTQSGSVTVTASATDISGQACQIQLVVRDTGIGIAPEAQSRLFQPFEQADVSITRRFGGTGLGLYISRQIARAMGGDIVLESTLDVGTCTTVTMNMTHASADDIREIERNAGTTHLRTLDRDDTLPADRRPLEVLLVDDNAVNLEVARGLLEVLPYRCTIVEARNGRDAIETFTRQSFDVVLMDCRMPEMDGITAVRLIRAYEQQQPAPRRVPILAVTASTYDEDHKACIEAGFDEVLQKPFTPERLQASLARWFAPGSEDEGAATAPARVQGRVATLPADGKGIIDERALDQFCQGSTEFLEQLVDIFAEELPLQIDRMLQAASDRNVPAIASSAHSLKSSSASLGATRLSELCSDIEHLTYERTADTVDPDAYDLVAQCAQQSVDVIAALRACLATSKASGAPGSPGQPAVEEAA
ncbi:MAG: ATP-binding protein [Hyphomicrobiaceae bacterium]